MSVSIESPCTAPAYRLFVGVDIAAATLTAVWTTPGASPSRPLILDQTPGGFATLQARLLATGYDAGETLIVMKATGSYWMALATTLTQAGFAVSVINPDQAHHCAKALLQRAKTDAIDARSLAQRAALLQPAPWTPPPTIYTALQQRLAERDTLVGLRQHVRNQLHALVQLPMVIPAVRADGGTDRDVRRPDRGHRARNRASAATRRGVGNFSRAAPEYRGRGAAYGGVAPGEHAQCHDRAQPGSADCVRGPRPDTQRVRDERAGARAHRARRQPTPTHHPVLGDALGHARQSGDQGVL